jgi:hypothetical protein
MQKWLNSNVSFAKPDRVDQEKGIIYGVSCNTVGEAKGHGVNLDQEFVDKVTMLGNEKKQGVKARFGHPNMCSTALGTFLGRLKNFRTVGQQSLADLYLSNSAKDAPSGDLHEYVLSLADGEPDMFGMSICFSPGEQYTIDDEGNKDFENLDGDIFVEIEELHACDVVDDPAANENGLFSSFSGETLAGQFTEFLDTYPQVWESIKQNEELFKSLICHGDKMDEFFANYNLYKGGSMSEEINTTVAEPTVELSEVEEVAEPIEETLALEEVKPVEEVSSLDISLLDDLTEQYGAEIAVVAIKQDNPLGYAAGEKIKELEAEISQKDEIIDGLNEKLSSGVNPVDSNATVSKKKKLFKDKVI